MSEFRIDQIKSQDASRGPDVAGITTFTGTSGIVMPSGDTAYRGGRGRGVFGGGWNGSSNTNTLQYITISTTGNAVDFGDLTSARRGMGRVGSNGSRGVFGGGFASDNVNTIDYVTIPTTGSAFDFGDLLEAVRNICDSGFADSTRAVCNTGTSATNLDLTQYVTIASRGDAIGFGDLAERTLKPGGLASPTTGVLGGGQPVWPNPAINVIQYVTIATTGNFQDFGDLTRLPTTLGALSSGVRGVFGGGYAPGSPANVAQDVMDYITIASKGNAVDFGNLTQARGHVTGVETKVRGVFVGSSTFNPTTGTNVMDYITIATTGNATDFGDEIGTNFQSSGVSDSHGGLG